MWYLMSARRFSALKRVLPAPQPIAPTSKSVQTKPVYFSISPNSLLNNKFKVQGTYFPLYNRELRLDNRWQQRSLQLRKIQKHNLLIAPNSPTPKFGYVRRTALLQILQTLIIHLIPLLRAYRTASKELSWTDLLSNTFKGLPYQYRSTRSWVKPKRAFNWFRERPYLFLRQRPRFESKLDWVLHSTLFNSFLAYKNTLKRFSKHLAYRMMDKPELRRFRRRNRFVVKRLRRRPLRWTTKMDIIRLTPRLNPGILAQDPGIIGLSVKLRKTFLNTSIVLNRANRFRTTHTNKGNFWWSEQQLPLVATQGLSYWSQVRGFHKTLVAGKIRTLGDIKNPNTPSTLKSVIQRRLKKFSKSKQSKRRVYKRLRFNRVITYYTWYRLGLSNRYSTYTTEHYFKKRIKGRTVRPSVLLFNTMIKKLYFSHVLNASLPHASSLRRRFRTFRRTRRNTKRKIWTHMFNLSNFTRRRYLKYIKAIKYDIVHNLTNSKTSFTTRDTMFSCRNHTLLNLANKLTLRRRSWRTLRLFKVLEFRSRRYGRRPYLPGSPIRHYVRQWFLGNSSAVFLSTRLRNSLIDSSKNKLTPGSVFYRLLEMKNQFISYNKPTNRALTKSNYVSRLWLSSAHKISFILPSYSFTYVTRVNDPSCNTFTGGQFPLFKYRRYLHSFLYLNEIKRYILRRHRVSLRHFSKARVGNFNRFSTFKNYLAHYRGIISFNILKPSLGQFFQPRDDRVPYDRFSRAVRVKRVRFKPGYYRIWRNVRAALQESLNLSFRYQHRLTSYLPRFYKLTKFQSLYALEMRLSSILIYANLVPDYEFSKYFIENNLVYVNGYCYTQPGALIVLNDFIQLIVSLKYYIANRWLSGWKIKKHMRLKKLSNAKYNNQSRSRLDKQVSTRLPAWLYRHKYKYYDVPNYLELDYFTLSAFMIYDPFLVTDFNPTNSREFRVSIYKNYNWKYIT